MGESYLFCCVVPCPQKKGAMAWQDTTTIHFNLFTTTYRQVCFQQLVCPALPRPAPPCLALPIEKVTWQGRMQQPSILICAKQLAKCTTINLFRLCKRLPKHHDECLRVNHKSCFCCVMPRPQKGDMAWHGMAEQPSISTCPQCRTNLATNNHFQQL